MYKDIRPDILIGTFVNEAVQQNISQAYQDTTVLFADYSPDFLFDTSLKNEKLYLQIAFLAMEKVAEKSFENEEEFEMDI